MEATCVLTVGRLTTSRSAMWGWAPLPVSRGPPLSQGTVGEVCDARHSGNHALSRNRTRQSPTAGPALLLHLQHLHDFPAISTSAVQREDCRTPVLIVATRAVVGDLRGLVLLPRPEPDSTQHARLGSPPSPAVRQAPPTHTRGSSPASGSGSPPPPALFVAASSCRSVKLSCRTLGALLPQAQQRQPRQPRACSHQRRPRVGRRAAVPVHRAGHSSTESCCARSAGVRAHLVHCWSRAANAAPTGSGVPVEGGA